MQRVRLSDRQLQMLETLGAGRGRRCETSPDTASLGQRSEWVREWVFPNRAAADAWNREWREVACAPSRVHRAFLELGGLLIADRLRRAAHGLVAEVLKREAQAGGWVPIVLPGWRYRCRVVHESSSTSEPGVHSRFLLTVLSQVRQADGALWWETETRRVPSPALSDSQARELARVEWPPVTEIYLSEPANLRASC
ncbi:MAG: hypothetical protein MJE66_12205 [Proteobacteria bacterium]|nr:hypothetical protein [Pseudomonadota bacterium]